MNTMRLLLHVLALMPSVFSLVDAWDCSIKCGQYGYDKCMAEKKKAEEEEAAANANVTVRHRELESDYAKLMLKKQQQPKATHLRGRSNGNVQRQLYDQPVFDFQIKMYWKEGYCWQEEWRERQYCWQCWGGYQGLLDCHDGEKVQINTCNASVPSQRWTYTPETSDYGRISPSMNTSLCFTGINATHHRLSPCDVNNTMQLFSGWKPTPKFELYPYGTTGRCVTQEHDPKSFEQIIAYSCDNARKDKTNYWGIYNPVGYYNETNVNSNRAEQDDVCVIDLDLVGRLGIRTGAPFQSPGHRNIVLEQWYNGNLVVRDRDKIVWESGINEPLGDYYTRIQNDGNMITFRGEVGDERERDDIVWRSGSALDSRSSKYFFGLACDGSYVSLFKGTPNDIQAMYWYDAATWPSTSVLSAEDPLFFTATPTVEPSPYPSEVASMSPTTVPSSLPSFTPTTIPSLSPTAAPFTAMPSSPPSTVPSSLPTLTPTTNPTLYPTPAPFTAMPSSVPKTAIPTPLPRTASPTSSPSSLPSFTTTANPSVHPTLAPFTATPSISLTLGPMPAFTETPTPVPTTSPTVNPTAAPVPSSSPTDWISPSYQTAETLHVTPGSTCASNPDCYQLDGDCCPTTDGKFLACCDHYESSDCTPYSLSLRQRDLAFITQDSVFRSPQDDTLQLEQSNDGNLVIRDGDTVIWETNVHNVTGEWYTKLQGTGNLVTYPGVKDVRRGPPIWESGMSASWSDSPMFLGLDCTRRYLAVYRGTIDNPGERIWKIATTNVYS